MNVIRLEKKIDKSWTQMNLPEKFIFRFDLGLIVFPVVLLGVPFLYRLIEQPWKFERSSSVLL